MYLPRRNNTPSQMLCTLYCVTDTIGVTLPVRTRWERYSLPQLESTGT